MYCVLLLAEDRNRRTRNPKRWRTRRTTSDTPVRCASALPERAQGLVSETTIRRDPVDAKPEIATVNGRFDCTEAGARERTA